MSEAWLVDSIQKKEAQPLEAYDVVSDLSVDGKGIPWDKQILVTRHSNQSQQKYGLLSFTLSRSSYMQLLNLLC